MGRQELLGSAVCGLPPPCHLTREGTQSDCLRPSPSGASPCGRKLWQLPWAPESSAEAALPSAAYSSTTEEARGPGRPAGAPHCCALDKWAQQGRLPARRRLTSPGMPTFPPCVRQAPLSGPQLLG